MLRSASAGLRARLLLLILLAVLPMLGLMLYTYAEQRHQAASEVEQNALRLSRLAASNHDQLIESTHQLLIALALLPQVRNGNAADCSALFADILKGFPSYANLGAVKPNGDLFCSALPSSTVVNVADRAYFQRALQTRAFAIGDYQIGRITGKPSVGVAYPIGEAGAVQGVVFVSIDLAWFNQLAAEAQLPPNTSLTVIDSKGTILARYPDAQLWVGQSLPETPLVKAILLQGTGTAEAPGLDGVSQLYAFSPLRGGTSAPNAYVSIGIPAAAAFAEVDRRLARDLSGLGIVAGLALLAAWVGADLFILRGVAVLVNATQRLAAGDLRARTGLSRGNGALSTLARNFDAMAEALQQREHQRQQSAEALRESEERFRQLVELSPDAIFIQSQGRIAFVNAAGVTLHGAGSPSELIGQPVLDGVHPADRGIVQERIRQLREAALATPWHEETWIKRDGQIVEVEVAATPFRYQGKPSAQVIAHDITERKRAQAQIERQVAHLAALRAIEIAITDTASLDLRLTLDVLLEHVTKQLGVDAADVLLFEAPTQTLRYAAGRGFRTVALKDTRLRLGEGYAGRAALERQLVSVPDLSDAPGELVRSPILPHESFVAYYATPLIAKGQVKGVLELFHRAPLNPNSEWLDFLEALAGQAAIAMDSAALFGDLQHSNAELALAYDATLEGWSRALDMRDHETEGHTQRVTEMTVGLAQQMGISMAELVHVRRGRSCTTSVRWAFPMLSCSSLARSTRKSGGSCASIRSWRTSCCLRSRTCVPRWTSPTATTRSGMAAVTRAD